MSENDSCLVCGARSWEGLIRLDSLPVFRGCSKKIQRIRSDLEIIFCKKCGLIRKNRSVALKERRASDEICYPLTCSVKQKMEENEQFYIFLKDRIKSAGSILDIGCHDGHFLSLFKREGCKLFGCEPSFYAKVAKETYGINIRQDLFKASLYKKQKFDIVVLRNILHDVYNPLSMLRDSVSLIKPGGSLAIEHININEFLCSDSIPKFSHELIYYFSFEHIKALLYLSGMELIDFVADRRMYFFARKIQKPSLDISFISFKGHLRKAKRFQERYRKNMVYLQRRFNNFLQEWEQKRWRIAFYGAGTFAQTVMSLFGIRDTQVDCLIDSDPFKAGRYLQGTRLKIVDNSVLKKEDFDVIVITSSYHREIADFLKKMRLSSKILAFYPRIGYIKK